LALKQCKECGHDISSKAKECMNCGAPVKKTSVTRVIVLLFILIFAVVLLFDKHIGKNKTTYSSPVDNTDLLKYGLERYAHKSLNVREGRGKNFKKVDTINRGDVVRVDSIENDWGVVYKHKIKLGYVFSPLLEYAPLPDFEIVSWNWRKDPDFGTNGTVIWRVQVRNNTSNYVELLKVEFTSFDSRGNIVDTDYVYVNALRPYGTASDKGYATYYGTEKKASIRIVP
jgi:SH3 domain-containing protein/zinc ribbon protein